MPRKRRTKLVQRSKPMQPEEESSHAMPEDVEKLRLEIFLKDFDLEVEKRVTTMRSKMKSLCSNIHRAFNLEILKLPNHVRDMKRSKFFDNDKVHEIEEDMDIHLDKLLQVEQMKTGITALQNGTSTMNKNGRPKRKTATTKKTKRATTARQKKTVQDENDPTATVVKATRQSSRASSRKRQLETPANTEFSYPGYDTPFMTPKFDPRLPVTPAMARPPKRGEVLMSYAGSPVINENGDISTQAVNKVPSISTDTSILKNLQRLDEGRILEELEEASLDETTRKEVISKLHAIMDRILKNTADG